MTNVVIDRPGRERTEEGGDELGDRVEGFDFPGGEGGSRGGATLNPNIYNIFLVT